MTEVKTNAIPHRLKNVNKEHPYIGGAMDIYDDEKEKSQEQVNKDVDNTFENHQEQINTEKQRAESVEGGLNTRLQTVEQLAEISVGGGDIGIGTAADFESDDPSDLAKVPTISAILGSMDDEPTAGSNNLVKSGGVYSSFNNLKGIVDDEMIVVVNGRRLYIYNNFKIGDKVYLWISGTGVATNIRFRLDDGSNIGTKTTSDDPFSVTLSKNSKYIYVLLSNSNITTDGTFIIHARFGEEVKKKFIDVSEMNDGTTYASLTAAIAAIPEPYQKANLTISFNQTGVGYVRYMFTDPDVTNFNNESKWLYIGGRQVFNLSAYYASGETLATYAGLSDALTALNTIPAEYKSGGMSFMFVDSTDNKYHQYRFMLSSFTDSQFANVRNWQGIDVTPTVGSDNLVKSGGVEDAIGKAVNYDYLDGVNWESGTLNGSTGHLNDDSRRARTQSYINWEDFDSLIFAENYLINVFLYDDSDFLGNSAYITSPYQLFSTLKETYPTVTKIKLTLRNVGNTDIDVTTDIPAASVHLYKEKYVKRDYIGDKERLNTTNKSSIVDAINEVNENQKTDRQDINNINGSLLEDIASSLSWEQGTINSSGNPTTNTRRARTTTFTDVENLASFVFSSKYNIAVNFYSDTKYLGATEWLASEIYFNNIRKDFSTATKVKFTLRNANNTSEIDVAVDIPAANLLLKKCNCVSSIFFNNFSNRINSEKAFYRSRMQFAAHRGLEWYAPENSVAAYEMAGQLGFEYAWIAQVRASSEGTLYVLHDSTLDRTTTGTGKISEKTDAEINALTCKVPTNLANPAYNLSDFTTEQLRIPTLEKALQICLRYGMRMCLRLEGFSSTEDDKWRGLKSLLDSYNIKGEQLIISCSNAAKDSVAVNLFGDDIEIASYEGGSATPQDNIDYFIANFPTLKNKTSIVNVSQLSLSGVKLLHSAGIKVVAGPTSYHNLDTSEIEELAFWGVDIYSNGRDYYI